VLSDEAREALVAHSWPGNVRELKNAIDRACLLVQGEPISPQHLNLPDAHEDASPTWRNLDEPSSDAVREALVTHAGVISRAAQSLGLSRQALYRRMQRYGIET
jgi:transcriptional regulator of acetoin/glycerol metabolism